MLLLNLLRDALISLALSGVVSLIRMIFSEVTWLQFWGGAAGIFVFFFFLPWLFDIICTIVLMFKDEEFRWLVQNKGMTYRDYKRNYREK